MEAVCRLEGGKRLVSVLSVDRMFDSPEIRDEIAAQLGDEATGAEEAGEMAQVDDSRGDEELFVVFRPRRGGVCRRGRPGSGDHSGAGGADPGPEDVRASSKGW